MAETSLCMAPVTPEPVNNRTSSSLAFTHFFMYDLYARRKQQIK